MKKSEQFVIGVVGKKLSGKGAVLDIFKQVLSDRQIKHIKSSDVLNETLTSWFLDRSRENLQKLSESMTNTFGPTAIADVVKEKILGATEDVVVFDGVRLPADPELIRSFPNNKLLFVTAAPEIRYGRVKKQGEKVGEENISFEQFMEQEEAPPEKVIDTIAKQADFTIKNESTMKDLEKQVRDFCVFAGLL